MVVYLVVYLLIICGVPMIVHRVTSLMTVLAFYFAMGRAIRSLILDRALQKFNSDDEPTNWQKSIPALSRAWHEHLPVEPEDQYGAIRTILVSPSDFCSPIVSFHPIEWGGFLSGMSKQVHRLPFHDLDHRHQRLK